MKTFSKLIDALDHQVAMRGDGDAVVAWDRDAGQWKRATWQQLADQVQDRSQQFEGQSAIVVPSDHSYQQIVDVLAVMRSGGCEISVDGRLAPQVQQDLIARAMRAPIEPDVALVLFTSGTTGTPKGVMLTDANLVGNAAAKLQAVPQRPWESSPRCPSGSGSAGNSVGAGGDVRLTMLPISHAYARTCDLGTWLLSGCTWAVTMGYEGLRHLAPIVRPTLVNTVPATAYRILDEGLEPLGLDRLRLLGCGGAAISVDAFQQFGQLGVTVIQGYGLTETGPVICSATPDNARPGMVGDFVDGWEHQIRGGELFVRGPHVMKGYCGDAAATALKIDSQGWLRTGDLVQHDQASGQLRILGRSDDVIVMDNGRKISPSWIERDVQRIAGVRNALLVWRGALELWIDWDPQASGAAADPNDPVRAVLQQYPEAKRASIHRFNPPLSRDDGELTAKGTHCRQRVLQNRLGHGG
ncbi:AMP-binding protein [Rubripirellula lacrimiformis]|uniref:AMP-binding protein n=1 Tax=Rubripirellula lacrimiformis TaxID=1930273 RepID=UPI0011A8C06F|nr:AMP-binding protein [Rubripirellula lacrimiformis]